MGRLRRMQRGEQRQQRAGRKWGLGQQCGGYREAAEKARVESELLQKQKDVAADAAKWRERIDEEAAQEAAAAAARTATPSRHGRSVCFVLCCLRLVSGTRSHDPESGVGDSVRIQI